MARSRFIEACALNIAAEPHPSGTYLRLFTEASRVVGPAHGSDAGKITRPKETVRAETYEGRILIWTDINLKGRWLDVDSEEELSAADKRLINIPAKAKPNSRVFSYVLDARRHRMYFESKNEFGETLGPSTAARLMVGVLRHAAGLDSNVEVTIVPRDGVVREVLALPGLRKLTIIATLPYPDEVDPAKRRRVFKRLRDNKAKRVEEVYTKLTGEESLTPTSDVRDLAEVAAENGSVKGEGRQNGRTTELSTAQRPRREKIDFEVGNNFLDRLLSLGRLF